ncbi:ribosome biogenesis protein [Candidatus Woesearchaeota archaeon]|nr:ribosome biogenesis protein [Candidatus Woesearchaeota archaeon]
MRQIMFCQECRSYTMKEACSKCGSRTVIPKPMRYSPDDHYASYRRKAKEPMLKQKGWL